MAVAFIILLVNIFVSRNAKAVADPWDGRTLEWSTPTPVPEYNFAQTPVARELDALWYEKMQGNKKNACSRTAWRYSYAKRINFTSNYVNWIIYCKFWIYLCNLLGFSYWTWFNSWMYGCKVSQGRSRLPHSS